MTDWSQHTIKLDHLNKQLVHNLNEENYKAAFEISNEIMNIGVKLQMWTFGKIN